MKSLNDAARAWGKSEACLTRLREQLRQERDTRKDAEAALRELVAATMPNDTATLVRMANDGAGVLIERKSSGEFHIRLITLDRVPDPPAMPEDEEKADAD